MVQEPVEKDLLTEFEQQQIPEPYKVYYRNKRHNLLSTIQRFPYVWNCFIHLDAIVQREFEDTQRASDVNLMLPMILYMNSHQKMRSAFEIGCATCLPEAHSLLRDAIESAAHAHRLASNPKLLKPWVEKNDSETAKKVFKQEFEYNKAKQLFAGLPELHKFWGQFSEFGSHTNLNSIVTRLVISRTAKDLQYQFNYLGGDPQLLVPALFDIMLIFSLIEKMIFKLAQTRLNLDNILVDMRTKFEAEKESTRKYIIKTFKIQRPR